MKKTIFLLMALAVVSCKPTAKKENFKTAVVHLQAKSGSNVSGTVTFTEKDGVITMVLDAKGLTSGEHAIHIHEKADCASPDGSSAGGHWNPTHQPHGKWGDPNGYHRGDIGNITVGADGNVKFTFSTDQWCLNCDDETKNLIGHSVIIHEASDDFITQPTGNAGGRISCGGIIELVK